jgi:hypothetical protein
MFFDPVLPSPALPSKQVISARAIFNRLVIDS